MDVRRLKGMEIAATTKLRWKDGIYFVPSHTAGAMPYQVRWRGENAVCTCADYEIENQKCKHIHAVEFSRFRDEIGEIEATPARPSYTQDWRAYNAAQVNEKDHFPELLKGLCEGIVQPPQGRGRPRLPLSDVIFSALIKTYSTVSGRRASSDIRECARRGHLDAAPHYNSIFKYLDDPEVTPILKALIEQSALPLRAVETDFAVDSSGFGTSTYGRWYDQKYGKQRSDRYWLKAHIMVGVRTNVVTGVEISGPTENDSPFLPGLLKTTQKGFQVAEVSADRAYVGNANFEAIVAAGAAPYIPFKSTNRGNRGSDLWRKLWHYYEYNRAEFLASYHKRSNVETTFSMIKRKFGASVRAKGNTAQINEVLCKIVCHNVSVLISSMYELGIDPTFWAEAKAA